MKLTFPMYPWFSFYHIFKCFAVQAGVNKSTFLLFVIASKKSAFHFLSRQFKLLFGQKWGDLKNKDQNSIFPHGNVTCACYSTFFPHVKYLKDFYSRHFMTRKRYFYPPLHDLLSKLVPSILKI